MDKKQLIIESDISGIGIWYSVYLIAGNSRRYIVGSKSLDEAQKLYDNIMQSIRDCGADPETIRREDI